MRDPVGAAAVRLIGRAADLARLGRFAVAPRGRVLVVMGDPGIGKTALLDDAAATARLAGRQVLRAEGAQFAGSVSYGGLNQLLLPLRPLARQLTRGEREALSAVLYGDGPPADCLALAGAALALVSLAADQRPVLLVVDDLHWLDGATALSLGLIARRLAGTRIGLLASTRPDAGGYFDLTGLPEHEVGALSDRAAASLLASRFPDLAPPVRPRLLAEAAGNPLALLELPGALTGGQRAGTEPLPMVLPATRRIQQLFAPQIAALPAGARQVLLTLALEETGDLRVARELLGDEGPAPQRPEDLTAVERSGLVSVDESAGRVVFRHPLIRSAAVELATSNDRRRAHQALAWALAARPDRQAWHLACAATGPDEEAAGLLASTAYRVARRGDAAGAVTALVRAAELSPEASSQARRLADAAYIAGNVSGELRRASQLLGAAIKADPGLSGTLRAATASSFVLLNGDGDVAAAHRLLVAAVNADGCGDDDALTEALWTLVMVCFFSGRPESWDPFYKALARLPPPVPAFLSLCVSTFADPARAGAGAVADLTSAIEGLAAETDPAVIVRIGTAASYAERLPECREALRRVVSGPGAATASAISAYILMGVDDVWTGLWDEAERLIGEGLALCESHGYELIAWSARYGQAMLAAARGQQEESRRLAGQMMAWAVPRGVRAVQVYAWHARALAALTCGDFEEAYRQAAAISPPGTLAPYTPGALWAALDMAEAAARTGRRGESAAHARAMREAGCGGLSPRFAAVERAAAALSETGDQAARLFEQALAVPGSDRWAFDRARIQLLYGERLRRDQSPARAREPLTAALEVFGQLGARPLAARAAGALRATGASGPARGTAPPGPAALTGRQREIALLAATGLSNKQIAEQLFLSPRTVSDHLHKTFPKLGVTSRAALRDALSG
jgi:DNA-binding CsgD family transcriptional regulator